MQNDKEKPKDLDKQDDFFEAVNTFVKAIEAVNKIKAEDKIKLARMCAVKSKEQEIADAEKRGAERMLKICSKFLVDIEGISLDGHISAAIIWENWEAENK